MVTLLSTSSALFTVISSASTSQSPQNTIIEANKHLDFIIKSLANTGGTTEEISDDTRMKILTNILSTQLPSSPKKETESASASVQSHNQTTAITQLLHKRNDVLSLLFLSFKSDNLNHSNSSPLSSIFNLLNSLMNPPPLPLPSNATQYPVEHFLPTLITKNLITFAISIILPPPHPPITISNSKSRSKFLKGNPEQVTKHLIKFPMIAGKVLHKHNLSLPRVLSPTRYYTLLLASFLSNADDDLLVEVVKSIVTHGGNNDVAEFIIKLTSSTTSAASKKTVALITNIMQSLNSPRTVSRVLLSVLRILLKPPIPPPTSPGAYKELYNSNLKLITKFLSPTLKLSPLHLEAFWRLCVLESYTSPPLPSRKQMKYSSFSPLLQNYISSILLSFDMDDDKSLNVLIEVLREVSTTWSEDTFVDRVDLKQQSYVTEFIISAIRLITTNGKVKENFQNTIVSVLVQGVSTRLNSTLDDIRRHGMIVAVAFAGVIGGAGGGVEFEELSDYARGAVWEDLVCADAERKLSEDVVEGMNAVNLTSPSSSDSYSDSDSDSDEVEFSDDEADLHPIPPPVYLRDLLLLLRAPEIDTLASLKQTVALKSLSRMVRSNHPDLNMLAQVLTKELLYLDNKFDLPDFSTLRDDGMTSLIVCAPKVVSDYLIDCVFESSVGTGGKFEVFEWLGNAAVELSGGAKESLMRLNDDVEGIGNKKKEIGGQRESKTSGKRALVQSSPSTPSSSLSPPAPPPSTKPTLEQKTRRWGTKSNPKSFTNKFTPLSYATFFQPLLNSFLGSQTNADLWSNSSSSALVSRLLGTLNCFVMSTLNDTVNYESCLMAKELVKVSWSFKNATDAELRRSVLISLSTAVMTLPLPALIELLNELSSDNSAGGGKVEHWLGKIEMTDADEGCRHISKVISESLRSGMMALLG